MTTIEPTRPAKRSWQRVTDLRIETYLRVLEKTGSRREAARAASPHASEKFGAQKTFDDLRKFDPTFADREREATAAFLGRAEKAVSERAFTPHERVTFDRNGNVTNRDVRWADADKLLLRLLGRHDPSWRESRALQVDGTISVQHTDESTYRILPADVLALDRDDQRALVELLSKIEENRSAQENTTHDNRPELIEQPLQLPPPEDRGGGGDSGGA